MTLTQLRELAEKATPGPWDAQRSAKGNVRVWCKLPEAVLSDPVEGNPLNCDYIAAMNPQTALALIAVAEAAERLAEPSGMTGANLVYLSRALLVLHKLEMPV